MNHSVNQANEKVKKAQGLLARIRNNNSGNFAIMAGAILPVICVGGLYGVDAYYRVMKTKKFNEYVVNACHRAIKPTRTQISKDKDRKATAQALAEGSFPKGEYDNLSVTTTAGWLSGTVKANATFKPILKLIDKKDVSVNAEYSCDGIPPYPHDDEVVMEMEFTNAQGSEIEFTHGRNGQSDCWGIYDHTKIGWSGSQGWEKKANVNKKADFDPGHLEIQYWGERGGIRSSCFSDYKALPEKATSDYAIELDGNNNNEMWRDVELHPGHYELSLWYYPRPKNGPDKVTDLTEDRETNGIGIYLEGRKGKNKIKKTPAICFNGDAKSGWKKLTYKFLVEEYNIYRFYAKGEQKSDTYGGVFNSFELKYKDDLNSTKTFTDEYPVGKSPFTSYKGAGSKPNCTDYLNENLFVSDGTEDETEDGTENGS